MELSLENLSGKYFVLKRKGNVITGRLSVVSNDGYTIHLCSNDNSINGRHRIINNFGYKYTYCISYHRNKMYAMDAIKHLNIQIY